MVKVHFGFRAGGIGITWGGNKLFGWEIDIYLLVLSIHFQITQGDYGVKDGE